MLWPWNVARISWDASLRFNTWAKVASCFLSLVEFMEVGFCNLAKLQNLRMQSEPLYGFEAFPGLPKRNGWVTSASFLDFIKMLIDFFISSVNNTGTFLPLLHLISTLRWDLHNISSNSLRVLNIMGSGCLVCHSHSFCLSTAPPIKQNDLSQTHLSKDRHLTKFLAFHQSQVYENPAGTSKSMKFSVEIGVSVSVYRCNLDG